MSIQSELVKKDNAKLKFLKKKTNKKVIIIVAILVGIFAIVIGFKKFVSFESETTKIGFEDIGELATQTAYCTKLNITENSRDLFGVTIPLTQSKYIIMYFK